MKDIDRLFFQVLIPVNDKNIPIHYRLITPLYLEGGVEVITQKCKVELPDYVWSGNYSFFKVKTFLINFDQSLKKYNYKYCKRCLIHCLKAIPKQFWKDNLFEIRNKYPEPQRSILREFIKGVKFVE